MKKLLVLALAGFSIQSVFAANLVVNNQVLTMFDPTYDRVDEFGIPDPVGLQVNYQVLDFYVTQSGLYDVEMAIRNTNTSADTYVFVYDPALNPTDATLNFLAGDDDSSDALTVLSGGYFTGASGRSRIDQLSLTANTQYQAVMTTFDFSATFFEDMTYDLGIGNGVGDVIAGNPVPEPTTLAVLGMGSLLAIARRRRQRG